MTRRSLTISKIGLPILSWTLLLITTRLLLPIEIPFVYLVELPGIFPKINDMFNFTIYSLSDEIKINLYNILGVIWLVGILINTSRLLQKYSKLCRIFNNCSIKKNINPELFSLLNKEIKIPHNLRLVESALTSVPIMYGFFRPTIVFPVNNFTITEEYFIIRHELQHYFNRDNWSKLIIEFSCSLYWWNPFTHLLRNQTDKILEIKTDFALTKTWGEYERLNYLEFIVKTYRNTMYFNKTPFAVTLIHKNKSIFMNRFELLLSQQKHKYSKVVFHSTRILVSIFFVCSLIFVIQPRYSFPDNFANITIDITPDTAYLIKKKDNTFDVYLNELGYFITIQKIDPFYNMLPIIEEKEDEVR